MSHTRRVRHRKYPLLKPQRQHVAWMFKAAVARYGDNPATRVLVGDHWQIDSYAQLDERVTQIAAALIDQGIERGDRVGIYSRNRPEWTQVELACQYIGAVPVPMYATNSVPQVVHAANDCAMVAAFAGNTQDTERLWQASAQVPSLRLVVSFDANAITPMQSLDEFAPRGEVSHQAKQAIDERLDQAGPDDLYSLIYTSGTTGDPKGVMLSHGAMLAEFAALDQMFDFGPQEHSLCFLPLSHALERGWSSYLWSHGCMNTYVTDTRKIAEAMVLARPNMMVAVPKLYETVLATAQKKVAESPLKKKLFDWAVSVGKHLQFEYRHGRRPSLFWRIQLPLADKLVLHSVRDAMGGPKKMLVSGGAPLRRETELFFGAAGMQILNGYGMTEAAPLISFNSHHAYRLGSVGRVMPGGTLRLSTDGEVLYQGPNVMSGYWGDEKSTREAFLMDGLGGRWLRTGDIGRIDRDGYLYITDRLKDIIVTDGGKNIAPQPIEALLMSDPLFEQAVILGDNRPYLTLLVKPSVPTLNEIAKNLNIDYEQVTDLVGNARINEEIKARADKLTEMLPKHEQFRDMRISLEDFTIANGLLTPTLKVKRAEVERHFHGLIEDMYSRMGKKDN